MSPRVRKQVGQSRLSLTGTHVDSAPGGRFRLWLTSLVWITAIGSLLCAQTPAGRSDAVPMELLDRWYQVSAGNYSGDLAKWIEEGQQILSEIRTLETLKDRALAEAPATLAEIEALRNRFVELLKSVERARIAQMSPQELQAMRRNYLAEREREMQVLDEERKQLIARAEAFRLTIDSNEFLTRHPDRAKVLEDFLYRLAELYYQDAGAEFLKAFDNWNRQVEAAREGGAVTQIIPETPKPDYSRAEDIYQSVLSDYPYGKRIDDCLFNLAKINESKGDSASNEKAVEYYRRLVKSYPDSPHLAMAYLGIGDYYFFLENITPELLEADMRQSIDAYESVLSSPDTMLYNDAYFKIGWAFFRINQFADAVDAFTRCIDVTLDLKDRENPSEIISFYQNSVRYLSLCFTSQQWAQGGLDNAAQYVQSDPKRRDTYGEAVIRQIGDLHAKLYEWKLAIDADDLYLTIYPLNPNTPDVHEQKITALEHSEIPAFEERDLFLTLYGPGSKWRAANPDPELAQSIDSKRETFLFKSTDEITTRAVHSADPMALEAAIGFCQRFLDTFPDSQNAPQVRMNLAMMLFNPPIQRFLEAYDQFLYICRNYPDDSQEGSKTRQSSAKNAVAAASAMIEAENDGKIIWSEDQRSQIRDSVVIVSDFDSLYPEWAADMSVGEILYCQALDNYLTTFPTGDFAPETLWRAGLLFFDNHRYPMSRYWLVQIEPRFAEMTPEVTEANKLILNSYILEKDFAGVEACARHILSLNIDSQFRESVRIRLAEAIFQSAEALREKAKQSGIAADHQASGLEFKRVADEIPDFGYADAALFNAGLELTAAQDYEAAVRAYQLLENDYPKSEYLDRALYNQAYVLGANLGRHQEAAEVNMRLFNNFPKSPLRSDALYNASQSYVQAGNTAKAIQSNQMFAASYPASDEAKSLLLGAAALLGSSNDQGGASQMYGEFAKQYPNDPNAVRACYERGTYLTKNGDIPAARREFQKAVDSYQQLSSKGIEGIAAVRPFASKSLSTILSWDYDTYLTVKLEPRSRLSAQIAEKKRLSESLMLGYAQLVDWSEAEAIPAMVKRAQVLEEYAAGYRAQAPPTEKDPAEQGEKLIQISRDAVGYQQLAIEEYQKALAALPNAKSGLQQRLASAAADEKLALDTLIAAADRQENLCRSKVIDLSLSNAENSRLVLNEVLNLQGFAKFGKQTGLKRQFNYLNQKLLPFTVETLGLCHLAISIADSAYGQGNDWSRKAREGSLDAVAQYIEYGQTLARNALSYYQEAVTDYGNVLPKGDGATLKGLQASDFAAVADDFNKKANIYAQATVRTGQDLIDRLHQYGFAKNQTQSLEDRLPAFVVEYSTLCEDRAREAENGLAASRAGYAQQKSIVYEDAQFVFEQWILVWSQYQLDILNMGQQVVEKFSIVSRDADQIMGELSALEPGKYGTVSPESPQR